MPAEQLLRFGPYRLDLGTVQVWRGKHAVKLTPKALALLRALVTRSGQVVTKDELLEVGWPQTVVSEDALTSCMQELRRALDDDARKPRYIETVHRRGFHFIAPLTPAAPVSSSRFQVSRSDTQHSGLSTQHSVLVGREAEVAQLHGWLDKALSGERQTGFVSGEPGVGKTTLMDTFLQSLESGVQNHKERQRAKGKNRRPRPST